MCSDTFAGRSERALETHGHAPVERKREQITFIGSQEERERCSVAFDLQTRSAVRPNVIKNSLEN